METKTSAMKILYTGKVHTLGGRKGTSRSDDGFLDIRLTEPNTGGTGTNPEQLFAAAWSSCYRSAMGTVARRMQVGLPEDTSVDAEVQLLLAGGEYFLGGRLNVHIPGMDKELGRKITEDAHLLCPYSKLIHCSVETETNLI